MKRFDPTKAAQVAEKARISGTPLPRWTVLVLCLWSFYVNRHNPAVRRSRSRKAVGGYRTLEPRETHRQARQMVRWYVRDLRAVDPKEVA